MSDFFNEEQLKYFCVLEGEKRRKGDFYELIRTKKVQIRHQLQVLINFWFHIKNCIDFFSSSKLLLSPFSQLKLYFVHYLICSITDEMCNAHSQAYYSQ